MAKPLPFTVETLARYRLRAQVQGYPVAKWVVFCHHFMDLGYSVRFIDAKSTVSKYVYLCKNDKRFKVRFSNHPPRMDKEVERDCDFYVGVTNLGVTTTDDAIKAAEEHFNAR